MALLFDSVLVELLTVVTLIFSAVFWYFNNAFKYWQARGIPSTPAKFPFGHLGPLFSGKKSFSNCVEVIYDKYGKTNKFAGFYSFSTPTLIVNDPEQVKNVFVRDFNHFTDRPLYYNEKDDPISAHLLAIEGLKWKNLRVKLSPTFTSGKLKFMFPTILERAEQLNLYLKDAVTRNTEMEIKDVAARFTMDVIGTCAFGIECNTLKDPDAEFRTVGKKIFDTTFMEVITQLFATSYTNLARLMGIRAVRPEVSKFFLSVVKDTIHLREENNIRRKDFMDLMIQLKNKGRLEDDTSAKDNSNNMTITENEIGAQAFLFFIAGFETSSSVMSFCLYELAIHQEIQDRTREEIRKVLDKYDGKKTYEALLEINYLDRVIEETMRKYPTIPVLTRTCTKDYTLPGTEVVIKKNTKVFIPVRSLHHDPDYYPDPEKFDPDRFTEAGKATRHQFTYLPFGEGPRTCIGLRFGMMQTRLGLLTFLMNYRIETTNETPIPIVFDPNTFLTASLGGIKLKVSPLS